MLKTQILKGRRKKNVHTFPCWLLVTLGFCVMLPLLLAGSVTGGFDKVNSIFKEQLSYATIGGYVGPLVAAIRRKACYQKSFSDYLEFFRYDIRVEKAQLKPEWIYNIMASIACILQKKPSPRDEKNMTTEQEEKNMTSEDEKDCLTADEYFSLRRKYWRDVEQSDGFDTEDVSVPSSMTGRITGLLPFDCQRYKRYPYRILVNLYAKLGLHRYNLLKGTSFELATLMKFNMLQNIVSSFYITLFAHDPDPAALSLQRTFQVRVDEQKYGILDLSCSIARPKDEVTTETPFIPHFRGGAAADGIFKGELPDWPSDDALNDEKRFYVLKEPEWQATDWICMYLELLVVANDRSITATVQKTEVLSQLEIVKVAIETVNEDVEPPNERLKAKSANVYIMFKGLAEARAHGRVFEIGEHVERKAIVRRVMDEHTGDLTLVGELCGGLYIKKPSLALQSCKKRARLS